MGIFTDPVTVVTDRTFTYVKQVADNKSAIFTWIEFAASVGEKSQLIIKQSRKRDIIRFLLKRSCLKTLSPAPTTGDLLKSADWNLTYTGDSRITEAQAQEELDIILALAQEANFVKNALHGAG